MDLANGTHYALVAGGKVELPFGGVGKSGNGREKGLAALEEFSTIRTLVLNHA